MQIMQLKNEIAVLKSSQNAKSNDTQIQAEHKKKQETQYIDEDGNDESSLASEPVASAVPINNTKVIKLVKNKNMLDEFFQPPEGAYEQGKQDVSGIQSKSQKQHHPSSTKNAQAKPAIVFNNLAANLQKQLLISAQQAARFQQTSDKSVSYVSKNSNLPEGNKFNGVYRINVKDEQSQIYTEDGQNTSSNLA